MKNRPSFFFFSLFYCLLETTRRQHICSISFLLSHLIPLRPVLPIFSKNYFIWSSSLAFSWKYPHPRPAHAHGGIRAKDFGFFFLGARFEPIHWWRILLAFSRFSQASGSFFATFSLYIPFSCIRDSLVVHMEICGTWFWTRPTRTSAYDLSLSCQTVERWI